MDALSLQTALEKKRGKLKRLYKKMLIHPQLLKKFSDLGGYLRFDGVLPMDTKKWTILYLAKIMKANKTFEVHSKKFPLCSEWTKKHPMIVQLIETYMKQNELQKSCKKALISEFGEKGFYELVMLIGFYQNLISTHLLLGLE